jgi:general secretion pathway protein G
MASKRAFWWTGIGVVIALAAALFAYRASDALRDDRALFTRADLVAIAEQLKLYKERHGSYPTTQQGLGVLVADKQFHELPRDFWSRDYVYRFPSARDPSTFDLFSLGPDGVEDTDDIWLPR